jgi:hypothetical protein
MKKRVEGTRHGDTHILVDRQISTRLVAAGIGGVVTVVSTIAAIIKCIVEAAP